MILLWPISLRTITFKSCVCFQTLFLLENQEPKQILISAWQVVRYKVDPLTSIARNVILEHPLAEEAAEGLVLFGDVAVRVDDCVKLSHEVTMYVGEDVSEGRLPLREGLGADRAIDQAIAGENCLRDEGTDLQATVTKRGRIWR